MSDDKITLESGATIELTEDRGDYHGTCYDIDDARRALADRPSMERELAALRGENLRLVERNRELACESRLAEMEAAKNAQLDAAFRMREDLRRDMRRIAQEQVVVGNAYQGLSRCVTIARAALKMEGGGDGK